MGWNPWAARAMGLVAIAGALVAVAPASPVGARALVPAAATACPHAPKPPSETTVLRPRWLAGVLMTEYFPAPERWFDGRRVHAPGLAGRYPIDWLYSARGLAMQGEGVGADGRLYHFAGPYSLTWRNAGGGLTLPCAGVPGAWSNGAPAWIGPTAVNRHGEVTYPLPGGAWSNGPPVRVLPAGGSARFAAGPSLSLSYWHDAAVDPRLIPEGSRIFAPALCDTPARGWLLASDTGGAIIGRHIDVFRSPPSIPWDDGVLHDQRIFVVPPGFASPARLAC